MLASWPQDDSGAASRVCAASPADPRAGRPVHRSAYLATATTCFIQETLPDIVTSGGSPIDPKQLEAAFSLFNEASSQLATAYAELQGRVDRLAAELAVANGELKRQYLEKEALSERLRLLLDALPGGVVVIDADDIVVDANPAAREWLGNLLPGAKWSDAARHLAPTPDGREWIVETPAGKRRLAVSESRLDVAGGRILLLNDVTEAARLQQQLEHHKRLSAMGEMAAGLAHQLRTPLATALLYTANLARTDLPDAERVRFSERVRERLRHLERMIQDMLLFVRGQPATQESVDIGGVLADVAQTMEPQMRARQVAFVRECALDRVWVEGDRKALTGALLSLLENALQVSDSGGRVALAAEVAGDEVCVRVTDDGPGMAPDVMSRVFEPFFTTRQEGTGLGLAIVRRVAEVHGGEVEVRSEPGRGSVFTLRLPAGSQADAPVRADADAGGTNTGSTG
ncbi:MAG: PAS domain-containing protein [Betaproteobacteria bacterium]|nr:PAS domain-containing protein [Betaproteobacteria bacterium]